MEKKRKKSQTQDEDSSEKERSKSDLKKNKKLATVVVNNSGYATLPSEILLKIFGYLSPRHKCKAASICRNWYRIARDQTLWYNVDLSGFNISITSIWKLFRQTYTSNVRSICLNSSMHKGKVANVVSPALLAKIKETCKHLKEIKLKFVDLNTISVNDLPQTIEELHLIRCEIPSNWFEKNNFKNLIKLDLSNSGGVRLSHIKDLSENCKDTLETLILTDCYRVNDQAIELLTTNFKNLICLKINDTKCTPLSIHWICTRLRNIQHLDIRSCENLKNPDIDFINDSYKHIPLFQLIK